MEDWIRRSVPDSAGDWWGIGAFLLLIFFLLLADLGIKYVDGRRYLQNGLPASGLLVNKYRNTDGDSDTRYYVDVGFYDYSQTAVSQTVDRNFRASNYEAPVIEEGDYVRTSIRINRRLFNSIEYGEPLPILFLPTNSEKARLLNELVTFPRWQSLLWVGLSLLGSLVCFGLYHRAKEDPADEFELITPFREV